MAAKKGDSWKPVYLRARASGQSDTASCAAAGVTRKCARDARIASEDFAQACLDAEEAARDYLRDEVFRRATQGVRVGQTWEVVDGKRYKTGESFRYSDILLMFATKQADHSYRDSYQIEVGGNVHHVHRVEALDGGMPVQVAAEARQAAARALLGAGAVRGPGTVIEGRETAVDAPD